MSPTESWRAPFSVCGGASGRTRRASTVTVLSMMAAIFCATVLRAGGEAVAPGADSAAAAAADLEQPGLVECDCEEEIQRASAEARKLSETLQVDLTKTSGDMSSLRDRLSQVEKAREDADRRASDAERMLEKEIDLSKDILAKASKRVEDLERQLEERGGELGVCSAGQASEVADLRSKVDELQGKLDKSEAEMKEKASILESKVKELQAKLVASETERDEAVQARSAAEQKFNHMVATKDAKIADLREELDEMETKEKKARDLLRHAHDERGDAQRRVTELTQTMRDREAEAGRHVCNLTLAAEKVGESTVWARRGATEKWGEFRRGATEKWGEFRRWSAPHAAAAGKEMRLALAKAGEVWDECVDRSGRFLAPQTEAFMRWYEASGMGEIVAANIVSPYEEHVGPSLQKLATRGREIVESGRLIAVSSVEEVSRWALSQIEKMGEQNTSYLSNVNVPVKVVEALRYTESNATEVVSGGFWMMCCLLVLLFCRPLLWFVLSIFLLPFRLFFVIFGLRGGKRDGQGAKLSKKKKVPQPSKPKVWNGGKPGRSGRKPTNGKKI